MTLWRLVQLVLWVWAMVADGWTCSTQCRSEVAAVDETVSAVKLFHSGRRWYETVSCRPTHPRLSPLQVSSSTSQTTDYGSTRSFRSPPAAATTIDCTHRWPSRVTGQTLDPETVGLRNMHSSSNSSSECRESTNQRPVTRCRRCVVILWCLELSSHHFLTDAGGWIISTRWFVESIL